MGEHQHPAHSYYDSMASDYGAEAVSGPVNALYERPATLSLLPEVRDARVLDAGCGSGLYAECLLGRGASVVGVDASAEMIRLARERVGARADFVVADLSAHVPFLESSSFDIVVAPLLLHHLEDWTIALSEFHRVLRGGGCAVVSFHHPFWDLSLSTSGDYFRRELVHDQWTKNGTDYRVAFYRRPLTEIFAALRQPGFIVDELLEPLPTEECSRLYPEQFYLWSHRPFFLVARLHKPS